VILWRGNIHYPCTSSQLGEKFTLLHYDGNIIDLFNLFGIHMYIVFHRWFDVWLFKFNHIASVYHHSLARSLHCEVTTTLREVYIVRLQPGHYRPFQFIWDPYIVYNRWLYVWLFKFNHWKDITCISSQLGEKFTLLQPGHHWPFQFICEPCIVYNRWLKPSIQITVPRDSTYKKAWSLHMEFGRYKTWQAIHFTRSTEGLMCDRSSLIIRCMRPLDNITTWREVYIITLQRQHHRPFQCIWDPYVYSL
jgi:hypothetical protein